MQHLAYFHTIIPIFFILIFSRINDIHDQKVKLFHKLIQGTYIYSIQKTLNISFFVIGNFFMFGKNKTSIMI